MKTTRGLEMYGSQLSFEIAVNNQRQRHKELRRELSHEKKSASQIAVWFTLTLLTITISTASFAGSKTGRLAGGNGNANGR